MKAMKTLPIAITALTVAIVFTRLTAAPGQSPAAAAPVSRTSAEPPAKNPWDSAEATLAAHLQSIDPAMRSGEFASNLVRRYLPDLRIFVRFDRHLSGETRIFLLNKAGGITPLPNEEWRGDEAAKSFSVATVTAFLKSQKIRITTESQAIDVARLYEELAGAANYVSFLHINTRDFKVFDKAFLEEQLGPRTAWKHTATRGPEGKGWTVTATYSGPPAHIQAPPIYVLATDDSGVFTALRRYHSTSDVPR